MVLMALDIFALERVDGEKRGGNMEMMNNRCAVFLLHVTNGPSLTVGTQ